MKSGMKAVDMLMSVICLQFIAFDVECAFGHDAKRTALNTSADVDV
jgi:hypothetical protein